MEERTVTLRVGTPCERSAGRQQTPPEMLPLEGPQLPRAA